MSASIVPATAAQAERNLRRVADRNYSRAVARIGRPIDRAEWLMAPQTPGAVLVFEQNAYEFAALLQPPKFDETASDAATYGAIGAIIGRELSRRDRSQLRCEV